jgi:hypothetical protein
MKMKMSTGFPFFLLFSLRAPTAVAACSLIPGADQIWARESVRWVLVGELHGSNEAPTAFGDLVCDALAHGKHITVAFERPSSEQLALDQILLARDASAAKQELLSQSGWRDDGEDGRASGAMLDLLMTLRELRTSHSELTLFAFDAPFTGNATGARDEAMGKALLSLRDKKPKDLILVLTGNAHAFQSPMFGYDTAAMYLPTGERLSLEMTDNGGEAWATSFSGACGPSQGGVPAKIDHLPREIVLDPKLARYGKVDGILSLGVATTASPPAAGEMTPLPVCRQKFIAEHSTSAQR